MNRWMLAAALLSFPLALGGCRRSSAAEELGPAAGTGAPPMPSMPTLESSSSADLDTTKVLRATGSTQALHQAELGPKVSGVLAAVLVDEGDKVKKGQPLFRLESNNAGLAVRQAQAGLAQTKVGQTQAEIEYQRTKSLYDQGAVSPAVWDQARLGYDRAQVAVQQAQVAVSTAQSMFGDTTVYAPFAGVITSKRKSTGETVTMMPPTVVLVIQDLSKIEVRVKLAENALSRLKAGSPMKVHFPSLSADRDVPIDRINPSVDPLNRTVEIVGMIANDDRSLKAGMLVEVTFPGTGLAPAVPGGATAAIPSAAAPAASVVSKP
jgi:RND family efflux transporter MFP subunit